MIVTLDRAVPLVPEIVAGPPPTSSTRYSPLLVVQVWCSPKMRNGRQEETPALNSDFSEWA
ncbi:MAG: hypothetical protein M3Q48_09365 [Actinomycetota bacterium]|nr:hypothetical protein [Actinomycetota bacterium]